MTPFGAQPLLGAATKALPRHGIAMLKTVPFRYRRKTRRSGISRGGKWRVGFMSKDELIIQLVKVALGILIAGYFLWWSLEVLKRLPPPH
jgi:hypothetical protein